MEPPAGHLLVALSGWAEASADAPKLPKRGLGLGLGGAAFVGERQRSSQPQLAVGSGGRLVPPPATAGKGIGIL
jgi:hypothetical protein